MLAEDRERGYTTIGASLKSRRLHTPRDLAVTKKTISIATFIYVEALSQILRGGPKSGCTA